MRSAAYIIAASLAVSALTACKKTEIKNPEQYTKVYMPQAIDYPADRPLVMTDELQTIGFGFAYGGVEKPSQALEARFKIDTDLVDSFNRVNGTSYEVMPAGSYQLDNTTAGIASGDYNSPLLGIKIKTVGGIEPLKDYLLPVTIEGVTPSLPINEKLRTTYFRIRGTYEDIARTAWSIVGASSQEATTNPATLAIDNKITTWWHTKWRTAKPNPPHNIVIDMGENKSLHGAYIIPLNQANGNPQDITLEVSTDNSTWVDAGDYVLTNVPERQNLYFANTINGRYLRVTINSSYGAKHFTHIAEIGAF